MDAIDKIIEEINGKADAENQLLRQTETARIKEKLAAEKETATKEHDKQLAKQIKAVNDKYKQLRSRQQVEVRQGTLKEKQVYLGRLFQQAATEMANWPAAEHRSLAADCLQALPVTEAAVFRAGGGMEPGIFTETWLQETAQNLAYPLTLGAPLEDQAQGFIVDVQGVYYNFLYQDLLNEIRKQDSNQITQKLFS